MSDSSRRRLPQWSWVLAALFFPSGVFVAYGCARLISWSRAILLALTSYGSLAGFVQLMVRLEQDGASDVGKSIAILGGVTMLAGWGWLLYCIGQRVEYWSPTVHRGWCRAGWVAVVLICLASAVVGLQFVAHRLRGS